MAKDQDISEKLYSFGSSLVGNRVFDLYLKFKGITTLTQVTLVPLALILGQQAFRKYLKGQVKGDQRGGDIDIPIVDSKGIGTYLKLAGLYHLPLTTGTLVPLGVLMALYEMYRTQQQKGGGPPTLSGFRKFAESLVGNRVLDLYLKYKGITTLTPYTLVPIALILGHDFFKRFVNAQRKGRQFGGKVKLPFVDDPLVGNYLKLAGLYHLPMTAGTLVPLGVIMVLYQLYQGQKRQKLLPASKR